MSPAIGRVDRTFEPGFPGGILMAALGVLLLGRLAHHSRGWFPFFECWLKKLLPITNRAGDSR